jgi:hypothetical protein
MSRTRGQVSADAPSWATVAPAHAPPDHPPSGQLVDRTAAPPSAGGSTPDDPVAGEAGPGSAIRQLDAMAWSELLHWFG